MTAPNPPKEIWVSVSHNGSVGQAYVDGEAKFQDHLVHYVLGAPPKRDVVLIVKVGDRYIYDTVTGKTKAKLSHAARWDVEDREGARGVANTYDGRIVKLVRKVKP